MNNKTNFTQVELQLLYAVCMSYGNKLSEVMKSIPKNIEQKNYEADRIKREELIELAIILLFEKYHELKKPKSINDTKKFYNKHFKDYEKYIMSEFWF